MSSKEWKQYNVENLIDLKMLDKPLDGNHGGIHPKTSDYVSRGIPFIMANDLKNGKVDYENCNYITEEQAKTLKKGFAKPGDVLLTHKATMGRTAIVDSTYPYIVLTPQITYYRVLKGIYNKYLKYYFDSAYFQNILLNWSGSGSTRSYLSITNQRKLPVILPPLSVQKVIANTLSCLDDKIELNQQMNKTLEDIAQTIFKSWFIDFDPVKAKVEGRQPEGISQEIVDLFPDGFKPSELGNIPLAWEVETLGNVLGELETGNRPKGGVGELDFGIPSIGAENIIGLGKYDFYKDKYVSEEYYSKMNKGIVRDWDVLLYKDGAQLGRKTIFASGFPHKKCCVNSHVFILRSNETIEQSYLYFWLDQDSITKKIINLNANSAQPGINQPAVKSLPILVPQKDIVKLYDNIVKINLKMLFNNCLENKLLTQLRDTLLPKLISGEIRVKDAGKLVGQVL